MAFIVRTICFVLLGIVLGHIGLALDSWELYAIVTLAAVAAEARRLEPR